MKSPLTITPVALHHIKKIKNKNNTHILIGVKGGGCNGIKYFIEATDTIDKLDVAIDCKEANIFLCGKSMLHMIGTIIDWKEDSMGARLDFLNPNASSKCGCGETFNI
jgi:iron-sulfur cluster assembly protein